MDAGLAWLARDAAHSDLHADLTLLVFEVDGHRYALHTRAVKELVRAALPARLAEAPEVIEGVLNIRGRIAAVLNVRARFSLARRELRASDVLILCEVGERLIALRVDAIVDLLHVPASTVASLHQVSPTAARAGGVVVLSDGLCLIADVPTFLDATEQELLSRALAQLPAHGALP